MLGVLFQVLCITEANRSQIKKHSIASFPLLMVHILFKTTSGLSHHSPWLWYHLSRIYLRTRD